MPNPSPLPAANNPAHVAALLLDKPEKALTAYLNAWKQQRPDLMLPACQYTWKYSRRADALSLLTAWFSLKRLESFGPIERDPEPRGPSSVPPSCVADFRVPVTYTLVGRQHTVVLLARVIRETAPYTPGDGPGSYWGVNAPSTLREIDQPESPESLST